ncbi:MAG: isoprenylcysteine carboxylmethyltransferase family protein [Atribacterota bacterium]|nr:isoprenylcysteine carboxylmethyltransferase family protein [Atribacterota bacterium]MDD3032072.1 isoprenylcysteine carboxylmethyltransferase family protein [Atribacterota bacterium]MDD3641457.1 isoprenylcysteine carboxylmethyltransferase family protein [Atribacterota bacterium]MDD4765040.1 isoprenylcysteine carboxylmethyltransferase family protein [Atribacterota bacterium]MDI9596662.1 isoprenylcysteine carboxylmethyltransferase family protein [Atribacterota bacterium]
MNSSHSHKHHNFPGEHAITDIGQLILFVIFVLVIIIDIFILKFSSKMIGTLSQMLTIPLFLLFLLIGGYFILISHRIIFRDNDKDIGIVTEGVFNIVRHPMYFGSILLFFSFVILSNSVLALLVWILICIFYYFISRYEEKLLINKFGDEYKEYQKKVPMFIPFIK